MHIKLQQTIFEHRSDWSLRTTGVKNQTLNQSDLENKEELNLKAMWSFTENLRVTK